MAVQVDEILKANLVLVGVELLNTPAAQDAFQLAVDSELFPDGAGLVIDPDGSQRPLRRLALRRDRIAFELSASRTVIEREFLFDVEQDLVRLAEVAGLAIGCTQLGGTVPSSFGYNIELVCDQDSGDPAAKYLASQLFRPDLMPGWDPVGGSAQISFRSGVSQWTARAEPRLNSATTTKIFYSFNSHHNEERLPESAEILGSLREVWERATRFAEEL